jgi:anaerobic selenocysteine-containing dehydrogenase
MRHFRTCPLCEAVCGLAIDVEDGRITAIRGDEEDPFSKGHICPKGVALQDVHTDPDRLRKPLRRNGSGGFDEIGWEEAFELVAERIRAVQEAHGRDAVAIYQGNPSVHNVGIMLSSPGFVRALGTKNRFSATSVDQLPHQLVAHWMFGHQLLLPIPDVDRTSFLLMLGANPLASNGSLMTAPDARGRLKAIRERGGRVILLDPRRTETAEVAEHHFVRPGTDAAVLLAMVHVIFAEGLEKPALPDLTDGLGEVRRVCEGWAPETVSGVSGVPAETIREIARGFAAAPSAVCYGRFGVSTQAFGVLCQWLVNVLNLVTGNLDRPGGAMFTRPAIDALETLGRGGYGRWRSRVRGLPEAGGELPVAVLAEEILTPGAGQVRALVTSAGNPVLSTPNGRQLEKALETLEFMVSIDFYLNETTRHAHVILPPTSPLEHAHYDIAFSLLSVRNVARYSPPLFDAPPGTKHDHEIFFELRRRLEPSLRGRLRVEAERRLGVEGLLDLGLRAGPYGRGWKVWSGGLTLKKLREHPHGLDLGPLEPALPAKLKTKDRRIHAAPPEVLADVERARTELLGGSTVDGFDLALIGRRDLRSNNSWMHNSERLVKGRDRCTLLVHPEDAAARGLASGARARLVSRVGAVEVPVEVTDAVMRGVVSLPHGWGHHRQGTRLSVASAHAGASINDVTDDALVDRLGGTAVLNGVPVRVEAL